VMEKRTVGGIYVIGDPDRTFSDENGVRDSVLSVTETSTVREAARVLGVRLGHHPTGRTVSLLIKHAMEMALQNAAASRGERRRQWWDVYLRAKHAMGKQTEN